MSDNDPTKIGNLTVLDAMTVYNAYRAKIVNEDTLIHYRITWMLGAQAILFAIWGGIAGHQNTDQNRYLFVGTCLLMISIFGIISAYLSKKSITAAIDEMSNIKDCYQIGYPDLFNSKNKVPKLHSKPSIHGSGMIFGRTMPFLFICIHLFSITYTWIYYEISNELIKLIGELIANTK